MRLCENCGKPLSGQQEYFCCPQCAIEIRKKESKEANALLGKGHFNVHETVKEKICEDCGAKYIGYPRSKRCPTCNIAAKKKIKKSMQNERRMEKAVLLVELPTARFAGKRTL